MTDIEKVLATAKSYVGLREKGTNIIEFWDWFPPHMQGQPYCARYVRACFWKNGLLDIAPPSESCTTNMNWAKQHGQWFATPKVGDVITFGALPTATHTGLVWAVDKTYVYTREGNTSDGTEVVPDGGGVCEKKYALTNPRILGYIRPKYKEDDMAQIIEEIAKKAGISENKVVDGLAVLLKYVNATEDAWESAGVKYLLDSGLISTPRPGNEPVEFGELGAVLKNLASKRG